MSFVSKRFLSLFSQIIILQNTRKPKHKATWPIVLQLISEKEVQTSWFTATGSLHQLLQLTREWAQVDWAYLLLEDWNQASCLKAHRGSLRTKGRKFCLRELGGHPDKLNSLHEGTDWKWDVFKDGLNKFRKICGRWRKIPNLLTRCQGQACLFRAYVKEKLLETLRLARIQPGVRKSLFIKAI